MLQLRSAVVVLACACLASAACGGRKGDDVCQQLVDKMAAVMTEEGLAKSGEANEQALGVQACRARLDETRRSPQTKCILAATSNDEVRACMATYLKTVEGEAKLQLHRIERAARRAFAAHGSFPQGTARQLPAAPPGDLPDVGACCNGPGHRCAVTSEWSSDPIWKALGFSIDEPSSYQYSYESRDGASFQATALGDMDCDARRATYTLLGKAAGATVTTTLDAPPRGTY